MTSLPLSCVAALLWLAGCSSVQLVPFERTRGNEALVVGSGIEVSADARQHPPSVPSNFTPVRLSVHNTGSTPLYVNLSDIDLEDDDLEDYDLEDYDLQDSALEGGHLAGPERALAAVPPGSVPATPRIASLGMDPTSPFLVQQTTSGSGPRAGRTESVILDPRPGSLPDWASARDGSRRDISRSAFRSGLIAAGETRSGFVYFRSVRNFLRGGPAAPRGAERVTLRVGVRSSPHGAEAAVVEIPYSVRS